VIVSGSIALVTTVLRLICRRHRLWWDDAFALFSTLCSVLLVAGIFMVTQSPGISRVALLSLFLFPTIRSSQCSAVGQSCRFLFSDVNVPGSSMVSFQCGWLTYQSWRSTGTRFARLSMLFSIIRVDADSSRRKRLLFVAGTFVIAYILLVTQIYLVCAPNKTWRKRPIPHCPLNTQIVVCQTIRQSFLSLWDLKPSISLHPHSRRCLGFDFDRYPP
jgi:hypothetical protein